MKTAKRRFQSGTIGPKRRLETNDHKARPSQKRRFTKQTDGESAT